MQIKLTHLLIENFKGVKHLEIDFGDITNIYGRNASGKTTIFDAFSWLMFDKDSAGSSAFAIRPKDAAGKDIDNIEIKVEAMLAADDEEIVITKTQKQKWVKRRGSTAPTFEGNVNEFQINGFPVKKNEYDQRIRDLIDENLFKLLTNPRTFAAMKWQDQRKTLMEFVSGVSDKDILEKDTKYAPIAVDVLAAGADKAREKAVVTLRSLKKQQDEYPVRIDEAMRNIADNLPDRESLDRESLHEQKMRAEEELRTLANERNDLSAPSKVAVDIQRQIMQKRIEISDIERSAAQKDSDINEKALVNTANALWDAKKAEAERDRLSDNISTIQSSIANDQANIKRLSATYKETATAVFPEEQAICPTCGRPFESDKIDDLKRDFDKNKKANLESINQKGMALREKINQQMDEVESIKTRIAGLTADIEGMNAKYEELKAISDNPVKTDVTQDPEYVQLKHDLEDLNGKLKSLASDDNNVAKAELQAKEDAVRSRIEEIDRQLTLIRVQEGWRKRVAELKEAQLECGQKVADQEQIVYLLEEFTKEKMDLLSGMINSHFDKVRFRLFTEQINGGMKDTCVMQINTNGSYVDYSDANNAAKILGGLDVIKALSTLYGVTAPIFLDNAEAIDSYNTPEMDAQLILLEVSDDKELHVERG